MSRSPFVWTCRDKSLSLGESTAVMGILNLTPDSFSDGGLYVDHEKALAHALAMVEAGATIIDIGGESTRPGSVSVSADEEAARILPIIKELRSASDVLISVDTQKAAVAREALELGADIVNDVSGGSDAALLEAVADYGAGLVLMHMQGTPTDMQKDPQYDDVLVEVSSFLFERVEKAQQAGVDCRSIVLDPGIGFGKLLAHNLALIQHFSEVIADKYPVLLGLSRKRFIGELTGLDLSERLPGSIAAGVLGVARGAHILRVHDVEETVAAVRVADALRT